jgi:hypothetical protein
MMLGNDWWTEPSSPTARAVRFTPQPTAAHPGGQVLINSDVTSSRAGQRRWRSLPERYDLGGELDRGRRPRCSSNSSLTPSCPNAASTK